MAGLPFLKAMLALPRHITFAMCPLIHSFTLVSPKQQYKTYLHFTSTAGKVETSHSPERLRQRHSHWMCIFPTVAFRCRKSRSWDIFPWISSWCLLFSDRYTGECTTLGEQHSHCQDSSTYSRTLQAKFPAAGSPLCSVCTARWALTSLQFHLQGAGNASFSPHSLKTWEWECCQMRGGSTGHV